jgi:prepilin-type N-terminal cleavage/methylation domain-containing protein
MRLPQPHRHGRSAFTLVEILVVIAIIAILIALLLVAIQPIRLRAEELRCFNDIKQLDSAVTTWQSTYKVKFTPPSQLFLSNNYADFSKSSMQAPLAFRQQSLKYLSAIWPRLNWAAGIDWSGGLGMPNGGVVLTGDQCLVFFLGGIPQKDATGTFGVIGFSTNPQNPTQLAGDHIPPQFEFVAGRLYQRVGGNPFLSYKDTWSTNTQVAPYLYFSSGGKRNGYATLNPDGSKMAVTPYYAPPLNGVPQFMNPNTCQIISAGRDGLFGAGGAYTPSAGTTDPNGKDDQSNFSDSKLGVPQ